MGENEKNRLWIDGHTHIYLNSKEGVPCDYTVDDVLDVLDRCDADLRLFCSQGGPYDVRRVAKDPDHLPVVNEQFYRRYIEPGQGRIFGCVQVDPRALAQSHSALDLYIGERGYVQVGEVEGRPYGFDLDCPEMIELTQHAAKLDTPVQLHCSTSIDPTGEHMRQALHLARAVPDAKIIIGHAIGGRNTYQYILAAETYLAQGGDNIYLEIYTFNVRKYLRAAYENLGAERILVGTDWATYGDPPFDAYATHITLLRDAEWWRGASVNAESRWRSELWLTDQFVLDLGETPYPCTVASYVGFMREAGISEADIDKIGATNAIELFNLKEKGLEMA